MTPERKVPMITGGVGLGLGVVLSRGAGVRLSGRGAWCMYGSRADFPMLVNSLAAALKALRLTFPGCLCSAPAAEHCYDTIRAAQG
jgi:hypothetical protein